jgi:hypothetical protein
MVDRVGTKQDNNNKENKNNNDQDIVPVPRRATKPQELSDCSEGDHRIIKAARTLPISSKKLASSKSTTKKARVRRHVHGQRSGTIKVDRNLLDFEVRKKRQKKRDTFRTADYNSDLESINEDDVSIGDVDDNDDDDDVRVEPTTENQTHQMSPQHNKASSSSVKNGRGDVGTGKRANSSSSSSNRGSSSYSFNNNNSNSNEKNNDDGDGKYDEYDDL